MEVNNLTFKIYKYLKERDWSIAASDNAKFIVLVPPIEDGFSENLKLKLPVENKSREFGSYMDGIINFVGQSYPNKNRHFNEIVTLNANLKYRYSQKLNWIQPENKSKIEKASKFQPYFPIKSSWR